MDYCDGGCDNGRRGFDQDAVAERANVVKLSLGIWRTRSDDGGGGCVLSQQHGKWRKSDRSGRESRPGSRSKTRLI